jgi:hypothetical protein
VQIEDEQQGEGYRCAEQRHGKCPESSRDNSCGERDRKRLPVSMPVIAGQVGHESAQQSKGPHRLVGVGRIVM